MTRRLHNWTYDDVIDFLKENGFTFYKEMGGSHEAWVKRGEELEPDRIVGLHFAQGGYHVNAMKRMIKASGIEEEEWLKWSNS